MLSYLSSWFWGSAEDPRIILCKDVVLEVSKEETGGEWVWVDVKTSEENDNNEDELKAVLEKYIIIPPYPEPSKKNPSPPETAVATRQEPTHRKTNLNKKRCCTKLRIYPPLKATLKYKPRKGLMVYYGAKGTTLSLKTNVVELQIPSNEQGFGFDNIHYKGLQGFNGDITKWNDLVGEKNTVHQEVVLKPLAIATECRTPAKKAKPSDSWCHVPEVHKYIIDNFNKLSTQGWSILTDSSGETLSSSMVRIWSIRRRSDVYGQFHASRLIESLCAGKIATCGDVALQNAGKPKHQRSLIKKKKYRRRNTELTPKPGHTSLIVDRTFDERMRKRHQKAEKDHIKSEFSFSRGVNSLVQSSREMFLALQVYMAQIIDSITADEHSSSQPRRRNQVVITTEVKRAHKTGHRNIHKKKHGRKNLARGNANHLQRCDKAVSMRRKAMGRGSFNCAVKRSF